MLESIPSQGRESEFIPPSILARSIEDHEAKSPESNLSENAFHAVLYSHLSNIFNEDLEDAGFSAKEVFCI